MDGQTLTTDDLLWQIDLIQKALDDLKRKVVFMMPPKYGSDAWWEKSDKKALEEIKEGKGITFNSINELKQHLGL